MQAKGYFDPENGKFFGFIEKSDSYFSKNDRILISFNSIKKESKKFSADEIEKIEEFLKKKQDKESLIQRKYKIKHPPKIYKEGVYGDFEVVIEKAVGDEYSHNYLELYYCGRFIDSVTCHFNPKGVYINNFVKKCWYTTLYEIE